MSNVADKQVALIVAMAADRVIGRNNDLPWKLSADLKRFKSLTMGCPIVMGRRTFDSIGRALPGRRNIILRRDRTLQLEGCDVMASQHEAQAIDAPRIFVIGGAQIYTQALPCATELYVTQVAATVEGDTWFPEVDWGGFALVGYESCPADARNDHPYAFFDFRRTQPAR